MGIKNINRNNNMNYNKVIIVGRTTNVPEKKTTQSGSNVCTFSVASNTHYKTKDNEKKEDVEFHNVVAFGQLADIITEYVVKGQVVLVEGKLKTSTWEDDKGNKKSKTDIIAEKFQMGQAPGGFDKKSE